MWRAILGVIGGFVAWAVIATLLNFGLRALIPGYHEVERSLVFTLPMMVGRLSLAVMSSIGAGMIIRAIAPASKAAPWIMGLLTVALFLPEHIQIGARLPLWYHLFFLITLAPLVVFGAQMTARLQHKG